MKTEQIAKICHEANRAYCECLGDNSLAIWEESPEWQRESIINDVEYHLANPGCSPEDMHKNWLVKKTEDGWVHGPAKNLKKKTHPCILPYDKLPDDQKVKDFLFISIVNILRHGTIEPIFKKEDSRDTAGFVRGFVAKYRNADISREDIFEYLNGLTNFQR